MSRFKVNDMIDDIVQEYRIEVGKALKRAETKIRNRLKNMIREYMIDDYYQGYEPVMYVRTHQLPKSVGPFVEVKEKGGVYIVGFGIDDEPPYGPSAMKHDKLILNVKYQRKKKGGTWERKYVYDNDDADEETIFENFLAGIHPRVGRAGSSHIEERINTALTIFFDFEVIDIITQEIDKISI